MSVENINVMTRCSSSSKTSCIIQGCRKHSRRYFPYCSRHGKIQFSLEVKRSSILGAKLGLFTRVMVPLGRNLVEYTGISIPTNIAKSDSYISDYCLEVNDEITIDAKHDHGNLGRFINDGSFGFGKGCNSEYVLVLEKDELPTVWIRATRIIKPGEEILCNYGSDYWSILS
jgi:hypothetical protein